MSALKGYEKLVRFLGKMKRHLIRHIGVFTLQVVSFACAKLELDLYLTQLNFTCGIFDDWYSFMRCFVGFLHSGLFVSGCFGAGVKVNVSTPLSVLRSKSKSWLNTGLRILLYSLGKTNSISSSWLNHSFLLASETGFLTVRLTIKTTVFAHLHLEQLERCSQAWIRKARLLHSFPKGWLLQV